DYYCSAWDSSLSRYIF
nr:immunoglobulin light chain junction region [Macaca mulatta]MOX31511.1 immunoglobulin light chain junction region [Macaca mulatta]MOX33143.1 immunoglobulin light chain junction region [Macaca mulatta]